MVFYQNNHQSQDEFWLWLFVPFFIRNTVMRLEHVTHFFLRDAGSVWFPKENGPQSLQCFNVSSWRNCLGKEWEAWLCWKSASLGQALRSLESLSASKLQMKMWALSCSCHTFASPSWTLSLWNQKPWIKHFLFKAALVMVCYHHNRKVTKTLRDTEIALSRLRNINRIGDMAQW